MTYKVQCPNCHYIHDISLQDLTIAAGQLRCAHCRIKFDGYQSLQSASPAQRPLENVLIEHYAEQLRDEGVTFLPPAQDESSSQQYVQQLMSQSCDESTLTLKQYLGYLENFNPIFKSMTKSVSSEIK